MTIKEALYATIRTDTYDLKTILSRIEFFYAKGEIWESTINGNVWAPDVYPAGWKEIEVNAAEEAAEDQA